MNYNITYLRKQKKLSQEELAKLSGVSRATISKLETTPDAIAKTDTLYKIANALQVSIADIILLN